MHVLRDKKKGCRKSRQQTCLPPHTLRSDPEPENTHEDPLRVPQKAKRRNIPKAASSLGDLQQRVDSEWCGTRPMRSLHVVRDWQVSPPSAPICSAQERWIPVAGPKGDRSPGWKIRRKKNKQGTCTEGAEREDVAEVGAAGGFQRSKPLRHAALAGQIL